MNDSGESAMFKQLFKDWKEKNDAVGKGKLFKRGSIGKRTFHIMIKREHNQNTLLDVINDLNSNCHSQSRSHII